MIMSNEIHDVEKALVRLRDLEGQVKDQRGAVEAAVRAAHDAGHSWTQMAGDIDSELTNVDQLKWYYRRSEKETLKVASRRRTRDAEVRAEALGLDPGPPPGLSPQEAAEKLGVSVPTIYNQMRSGGLQSVNVPGYGLRVMPVETEYWRKRIAKLG